MPFTKTQTLQVIAALTRKTKGICPMCGGGDLVVISQLANIQVHSGLNFGFSGVEGVLPSVVTVCKNCGNVQFFNAHVLGVSKELNLPPGEKISPQEEGQSNG
jgi:hypothetical protein